MTVSSDQIQSLYDAQVLDSDGQKVGGVGQVYVDDQTGNPAWVTVKTGLFGNNETFVPLQNADLAAGEVRVPYSKDFIKGAPNIGGEGHLDDGAQQDLFSYYSGGSNDRSAANDQLAANDRAASNDVRTSATTDGPGTAPSGVTGSGVTGSDVTGTDVTGTDGTGADPMDANVAPATAGPADPGPTPSGTADTARSTDQARSADQVATSGGGQPGQPAGQTGGSQTVTVSGVRIRKHIVTEMQTITVPVQREVVEVVHEPLPNGQSADNEVPVNLDDVHVDAGQDADGSVADAARHAAGSDEDSAGSTS